MRKGYIIAHDTGTGGDKAVLLDTEGNIIASQYISYPLYYMPGGKVEQDPEEIWNAVALTTRRVISISGVEPGDILGIGISAQMFNLLPVDEKGKPLPRMISWLDTRSIAFADEIENSGMGNLIYRYTGNIPTAKDVIPKILWLKSERPDIWEKTYRLLDCKEYLIYRLTGKFATDWHGASVFFLFDIRKKRWSKEICSALGIPVSMLPDTFPSTTVIGEVTEKASHETGLKAGTPVILAAGDVAAAQVGSGSNAEGKAHICLGTATWIGVSTGTLRNDEEKPLWALNHSDPEKLIIAGEMETGGGSLMWLKGLFSGGGEKEELSAYERLGSEAESINVGSEGLIYCPWLSGERAPVLDHYARGAFVGLTLKHGRGHFARAVMEGVAYQLKWIAEKMKETGFAIESARAIGGGMTSRLWPGIVSDVTGIRLEITENPLEAGAIGTAMTVLIALGVLDSFESIDDRVGVQRIVEPDVGNFETYTKYFTAYREIYGKLKPIFRSISRRQGESDSPG